MVPTVWMTSSCRVTLTFRTPYALGFIAEHKQEDLTFGAGAGGGGGAGQMGCNLGGGAGGAGGLHLSVSQHFTGGR